MMLKTPTQLRRLHFIAEDIIVENVSFVRSKPVAVLRDDHGRVTNEVVCGSNDPVAGVEDLTIMIHRRAPQKSAVSEARQKTLHDAGRGESFRRLPDYAVLQDAMYLCMFAAPQPQAQRFYKMCCMPTPFRFAAA